MNTDPTNRRGGERRRGVVRTALILAAIVMLIYLAFIGQAVFSHFFA